MNKPEAEFWESIRSHLPGFLQRIETSTGNGVPDVYCCASGWPCWIELKVWTPGTGILLRKEQWAWGCAHAAHGGKSFVLTKIPMDDAMLLHPISRVRVKAYGKQEKYVLVTNPEQGDTVAVRKDLSSALKKYLFT